MISHLHFALSNFPTSDLRPLPLLFLPLPLLLLSSSHVSRLTSDGFSIFNLKSSISSDPYLFTPASPS